MESSPTDKEHNPELFMDRFKNKAQAKEYANWCLKAGYGTPEGAAGWWTQPHTYLDGLTPEAAWTTMPDKVIELAEVFIP